MSECDYIYFVRFPSLFSGFRRQLKYFLRKKCVAAFPPMEIKFILLKNLRHPRREKTCMNEESPDLKERSSTRFMSVRFSASK